MNAFRRTRFSGASAVAGMVGSLAALAAGCPDPDPMSADAFRAPDAAEAPDAYAEPTPDAWSEPPDTGGIDGGMPDAWVHTCPAETARDIVTVHGTLTGDTTWTCDHTYLLEADGDQGPLYVTGGATLTIEPGTIVRGAVRDGTRHCMMDASTACTADSACTAMAGDRCGAPAQQGTALVITRGSHLVAVGTAEQPIVFTSNNYGNAATPPRAGDWGGLVLLGDAPTNWDPPNMAQIEGLPSDEGRGVFGGSNADGSCGSLEYVRVEYAGYIIGRNNELNGITVGGCGSGTLFDHVQVHMGLDDGIELFGGSTNLRHVIVTGTGDDSLDFDLGWTGNVQFYVAQQRDVPGEDRCIEGDDHPNNYSRTPYSHPTIYNYTCIGAGTPGTDPQDAIALRRGGQFIFRNGIVFNSPDRGFFVQDSADTSGVTTGMDTISWLRGSPAATLLENNILFQIGAGPDRNRFFSLSNGSMAASDVDDILAALAAANDEGVDPMLPAAATSNDAPNFAPQAGGPAATNVAALPTAPAGFWTAADYRGAVRPGGTGADLWYTGWTRFTP